MSEYQPGTVAVATVRGVEGVRVMRIRNLDGWVDEDGYAHTPEGEGLRTSEPVTDIRPLVVLDPAQAPEFPVGGGDVAGLLREIAKKDPLRDIAPVRTLAFHWLADQIEAQARIPEPGPWGVVEATVEGWTDGPSRFVNFGGSWIAKSPFGTKHASWSDLIDPTLIREGVESDA